MINITSQHSRGSVCTRTAYCSCIEIEKIRIRRHSVEPESLSWRRYQPAKGAAGDEQRYLDLDRVVRTIYLNVTPSTLLCAPDVICRDDTQRPGP